MLFPIIIDRFFFSLFLSSLLTHTATADNFRAKRQDDDDDDSINVDELCQDRPADEYFRTSTEGDCRDVFRYTI